MASVDDIRTETLSLSDPEMRDVCLRLVDGLASRNGATATRWTFKSLSRLARREPDDPVLQRCIQLLCTRQGVKLLDVHFLFFDPSSPDDIGEPIDDEEVKAAYSQGFLVHPIRGLEIEDFEQVLVPYFQVSKDVAAHVSDR